MGHSATVEVVAGAERVRRGLGATRQEKRTSHLDTLSVPALQHSWAGVSH